MTLAVPRTPRWWIAALSALALGVVLPMPATAQGSAQTAAAPPSSLITWAHLTAPQRTSLAPLERDWERLSPAHQRKWLEIANRMPAMPADQQQRVRQRMQEWAKLSPAQRNEARINFQQAQQLPEAEKQARWEAYRALSPEQRKALAAKATPASAPQPPTRPLRSAPLDAQSPKSNLVRSTPAATAAPRPVNAGVVQAGQGATTNLVTAARPSPPAHHQAGMPKIAASPGMVDRATLLPKRGPQAAAALPASGAPMAITPPAPVPASASR